MYSVTIEKDQPFCFLYLCKNFIFKMYFIPENVINTNLENLKWIITIFNKLDFHSYI